MSNTKEAVVKYHTIVGGPSHHEIFEACKNIYGRKNMRKNVIFTVALNDAWPMDYTPMAIDEIEVSGIQYEDKTGKKLSLFGSCIADLENPQGSEEIKYKPYRFKAHYNPSERDGLITFVQ